MNPVNLVKQDALQCDRGPVSYLFFSSEVEPLIYYLHLLPAIAAFVLASVLLLRYYKKLAARIFFIIALLFCLFIIIDLSLWTLSDPSLIMFFWASQTYIEPLIFAFTFYLVWIFINGHDLSSRVKFGIFTLFLPIILLGPTTINLIGFDYTNCLYHAVKGPLANYYVYIIEAIFVLSMIVVSMLSLRTEQDSKRRLAILYVLSGSLLFLLAFSLGNLSNTVLHSVFGENSSEVGKYGLLAVPISLALIMHSFFRFGPILTRKLYTDAISLALWLLLISVLFMPDLKTARPLIFISIILLAILSCLLIQGHKNDTKIQSETESLRKKLEKANSNLKILDQMKSEFVSIVSHQLRSPLTSIRGYASMLLEGSFGKLTNEGKGAVERISESSRVMAMSVEDYLSVTRIDAGRMKYEIVDFNLKEMVEELVNDLRPQAIKKGLVLTSKTSHLNGKGFAHGDIAKTKQILHNLINNALKYTPKGTILVEVRDDPKKKRICVDVKDSGVGMSKEVIEEVFDKFIRARNANQVNVTGTGLGLYVARKMAEGMKGKLNATSEGEGKGSVFTLTLLRVR